MLDEQGWLDDVPRVAWEDGGTISAPSFMIDVFNTTHPLHAVHPSLQFISHIPHSITGEQLVNQFLRCIPDKTWLFKYGRVPLNLVMGEWVWQVSSFNSILHPFVPLRSVRFVVRFFRFRFSFGSLLLHLYIRIWGCDLGPMTRAMITLFPESPPPLSVHRPAPNYRAHLSYSGHCPIRSIRFE